MVAKHINKGGVFMILLIGGEKGGTGKSMAAVNIAVAMCHKKKEVVLIDADKQPTTSNWAAHRVQDESLPRIICVQKTGKDLHQTIQAVAEKYANVIIDVGGRDTPELRSALLVADVMFSPISPAQFDAETIPKLEELIGMAKTVNSSLKTYAFISRANPATSEKNELIELFEEIGTEHLRLADSVISDYVAYRKASRYGRGIIEHTVKREKERGEKELLALYKEIVGVADGKK